MDISTATTLASGLVALIAPALVQAFKTYIPSGYVGLVSLAVSILFGVIAIAATGGFDGTYTCAHHMRTRTRFELKTRCIWESTCL